MAQKSRSSETPVEQWKKIARSREEVARDLGGMRYELDFPLKFKKAFQRHTTAFVAAALVLGLMIALLRARTQKVYVGPGAKKKGSRDKTLLESGALLGLIKLAMTVMQPVITSYFAKQGAKKGEQQGSRRN